VPKARAPDGQLKRQLVEWFLLLSWLCYECCHQPAPFRKSLDFGPRLSTPLTKVQGTRVDRSGTYTYIYCRKKTRVNKVLYNRQHNASAQQEK